MNIFEAKNIGAARRGDDVDNKQKMSGKVKQNSLTPSSSGCSLARYLWCNRNLQFSRFLFDVESEVEIIKKNLSVFFQT